MTFIGPNRDNPRPGRAMPDLVTLLACGVVIVVFGIICLDASIDNHETIVIEDIADDYLKDTNGQTWYIHSMDPFERKTLSPGQSLQIKWKGWHREPREGEWIWVETVGA